MDNRAIRHSTCRASAVHALTWFTLSLVACQPHPARPPAALKLAPQPRPATIADEFITTFWCAPPLHFFDDYRAKEIADAGFNLVGASCEGPIDRLLNKKALDVAAHHGLRMLIKDHRTSVGVPLSGNWQRKASKAIAEYGAHRALAGFFLIDEPTDASFADIAAMRRRIRRERPGVIGYVNLLPDYVFPGPEDYREYVESYLFETRPDTLSYDHYPFLAKTDRPSFFDNLSLIRKLAIEYDVPFMLIVQLMPHASYRDVTYGELAWQAFHALAFGARGISYFAYWTPTQVPDNAAYRFRKGIIEGGLRTEHYDHVTKLNHDLRSMAAQTAGMKSVALWDTESRFDGDTPPFPILSVGGDRASIGLFASPEGERAAIVVNQSYREDAEVSLALVTGATAELFDRDSQTWAPLQDPLTLGPGDAALVRFD